MTVAGKPIDSTRERRRSPTGTRSSMGIAEIDRPRSLTEHAYQRLKAAIREGSIEPRRFYPLGDVAEGFGISRTPVREAVLKLSHEGLLEILPQRGFRIREISPEEADEVFELRTLLEGRTVEKLAKRASPEDVRKLRAILRRQSRFLNDTPRFLEVDEEFHLTMLELAGFRRARDFMVSLRDVIWLLGSEALSLPGRLQEVLAEHTAVVDHIEHGEAAAGRRSIAGHLESTATKIRRAERD